METRNNKHTTVYACYNANGYNVAIHNTIKIIQHTYGVRTLYTSHTCVHVHTTQCAHAHRQTQTQTDTDTNRQSHIDTQTHTQRVPYLYFVPL